MTRSSVNLTLAGWLRAAPAHVQKRLGEVEQPFRLMIAWALDQGDKLLSGTGPWGAQPGGFDCSRRLPGEKIGELQQAVGDHTLRPWVEDAKHAIGLILRLHRRRH